MVFIDIDSVAVIQYKYHYDNNAPKHHCVCVHAHMYKFFYPSRKFLGSSDAILSSPSIECVAHLGIPVGLLPG